jgi:hypothetical protein
MSFLSQSLNQLEHGQIADWARYTIAYIRRRIGRPLSPAMAEAAVTEIEGFKASVQAAAAAFLTARLGPIGGALAAAVADQAIAAVAAQVEAATRALEAAPAAPAAG